MTILCISPISIKNPNCGKKFSVGDPFSLKDCTSAYIRVPCGHCPECIALKQMYLVQRVQMESLSNYIFFATLTYNNEMLPKVTTSTGYTIPYADISDLQNCFKRLRKSHAFGRPFRYLAVSELGKKRGRPHFHVLFLVKRFDSDDEFVPYNLEKRIYDSLLSEWKRNYGSTRVPDYKPLCTFQRIVRNGKVISNYDLHYVKPLYDEDSFSNVAFYVLKYMLKRSDRETRLQQALHLNLDSDEYDKIWKLVHSRCICSKHFGLNLNNAGDIDPKILSHLREGISISEDFAKYFNPSTGKSFPLSRYYKSIPKIYGYQDALKFYFNSSDDHLDSVVIHDNDKDFAQLLDSVRQYEKKISDVADRGDFDSYANDFE